MENNNLIAVPGRLHPVDKDKILCSTEDIWDETSGKRQSEVNAGIEETVTEKVNQAMQQSEAIAETVTSKVNEAVPGVVAQALNEAVMPAVQGMINREIYGSEEKPEGISVVTAETGIIDGAPYAPEEWATNATYKLSVNGTVNGDSDGVDLGAFYAPTTAGTAGQYLKSIGNGAPVWADAPAEGGMTQEQVTTIINQTIYGSDEKPQDVEPVTTEDLKYGKVGYDISKVTSEGGAVTINATVPVHEITASANISGITFADNTVPEDGHSCHVIVKAAEALSVSIADDAVMATVGGTSYLSVCPESSDIILSITAGGYVEFDLFRIGENIYVRGI